MSVPWFLLVIVIFVAVQYWTYRSAVFRIWCRVCGGRMEKIQGWRKIGCPACGHVEDL